MSTGAIITLIGSTLAVILTLTINGARAERERRRVLYARALTAVARYIEMPYEIRRRRYEDEHRSAERTRLSERFSEVQAELTVCQTLMQAEHDPQMAHRYDALVAAVRACAGTAAAEAWTADPITTDEDVLLPDLHAQLKPARHALDGFRPAVAEAGTYLFRTTRPIELRVARHRQLPG